MTNRPGHAAAALLPVVLFAAVVKLTVIYLLLFPLRHTAWSSHLQVDVWSWLDFLRQSAAGKMPYVEFSKEYPVGIGVVYWALSQVVDGSDSARLLNVHVTFFSLLEIVNALLFHRMLVLCHARHALLFTLAYVALPTALVVGPFRHESLVNLVLFLGVIIHLQGGRKLSTVMFAVGTLFKWYPAFFLLAREWRELATTRRVPPLLVNLLLFATVLVAANLPFVLLGLAENGSIANWFQTYRFHVDRPLYWDTPLGVLSLWFGYLPLERYASLFSLLLMVGVALVRPRSSPFAKTAAIIIASLVCNRIYSTQFHLWFVPLCLVIAATRPASGRAYLVALLTAVELLNIAVYPFYFTTALGELGNFANGVAGDQGGFQTWSWTLLVLARPLLLVELLRVLLFDEETDRGWRLSVHLLLGAYLVMVAYLGYATYPAVGGLASARAQVDTGLRPNVAPPGGRGRVAPAVADNWAAAGFGQCAVLEWRQAAT